jgi:dihydropteroate synthase
VSLYASSVRPLVMGVLNVTPDSFFDGGLYLDSEAALRHGSEILDAGADIVDVGGESTRPGASTVPADEEVRRVVPVVEALAADRRIVSGSGRISIDTTKAVVAAAALAAGATMVNDVSASPELAEVAARAGAAYVAMHAKGTPADMQDDPRYDDVVSEVCTYLTAKAEGAEAAGVTEVWIDPGIGFGKTARHNLALLGALGRLTSLGWPVVVGTSRKTFLGRMAAGGPDCPPLPVSERLEGSLASAVWSMVAGAAAVRVHDVKATVDAARLVAAAADAARDVAAGAGR